MRRSLAAEPSQPAPTLANAAYGTHERQVLDFWKADSARPTPSCFISTAAGGSGDKARVANLEHYLAAGEASADRGFLIAKLNAPAGR